MNKPGMLRHTGPWRSPPLGWEMRAADCEFLLLLLGWSAWAAYFKRQGRRISGMASDTEVTAPSNG